MLSIVFVPSVIIVFLSLLVRRRWITITASFFMVLFLAVTYAVGFGQAARNSAESIRAALPELSAKDMTTVLDTYSSFIDTEMRAVFFLAFCQLILACIPPKQKNST